jgi:hypothetical protein
MEDLIGFSDDVLSKHGKESLRRFSDDSIGVFSMIEEESGKKVRLHFAVPDHVISESLSTDAQTPFLRINIDDAIDTEKPFEEMVRLIIQEFESLGIKINRIEK